MFSDQFREVSELQLRILMQKFCHNAKDRQAIRLNISPTAEILQEML